MVIPGWYPSHDDPFNGDFVKEQVRLMRQAGMHVDLCYADLKIAHLWSGIRSRQASITPSPLGMDHVITGPFWPKFFRLGLMAWIRAYARHALSHMAHYGSPDILHAHTYLGGAVARVISYQTSIPYLITEHYTGIVDGTMREGHRKVMNTAYRDASVIIAVSQALATAIKEQTSIVAEVVPNVVDVDSFILSDRWADGFHWAVVGDLIPRKNHVLLLDAMYRLKGHARTPHLHVIGSGPLKKDLRYRVSSYGLDEAVTWHGQLLNQDVAKVVSKCHALVHPSKTETFGIALIEALSSGLPIVATDSGGVQDIVGPRSGILVDQDSADLLSRAMIKMMDTIDDYNPEELRQLVIDRFGPAAVSLRLEGIYRSVLDLKC